MRVIEIFKSIDGEGIRAGFPVTFIRLAGCNLRCSYCDTKYSYDEESAKEMTFEEIHAEVYRMGCKKITLTGGEPLIHEDVDKLIDRLLHRGFQVNIETNGSVDISPYLKYKTAIITMDYKCPSSGMESQMILGNIGALRSQDVLKFVVGNKEDLDICRNICSNTKAQVFISPIFNRITPKEIVEYILEHNMLNCRVQVQLHKIIWDPNMKGV